jgi:hypothetical protein
MPSKKRAYIGSNSSSMCYENAVSGTPSTDTVSLSQSSNRLVSAARITKRATEENEDFLNTSGVSAHEWSKVNQYCKMPNEQLFHKLRVVYGQFGCNLTDDMVVETAYFGAIISKLFDNPAYLTDDDMKNDSLFKWGKCLFGAINRQCSKNDRFNYISDGSKYFGPSKVKGKYFYYLITAFTIQIF